MMKTKHLLIALLPLLTVCFISNLAPYIYIPSLPSISSEFRLSESEGTNLLSAYYLTLSITLLIVGTVGDVWNKKILLVFSSTAICIGSILSAITNNINVLLLGWVLQAVGAATITIVSQAWIGQSSTKENITRLFTSLGIILSLAPLIAPILGGVIDDRFSWRYNFYILAGLSLLASLFIYRTTPPPIEGKKNRPAKDIIGNYYQILFKTRFIGLIGTSLVCFLFQGALMAYSSFLFVDELKIKSSEYGLISIPVIAGIILGQLPISFIEKKWGIIKAHAFSSIIIVTALTISVIYYLITGTHTIIELAIIVFIFNIGFGGHTLIALRNVMSEYPSQRSYASASMNFLNHISAYIASVLVQVLFTYVSSAMQIHTIMAAFFVILIILSFFYFRRTVLNNESSI